MVMGLGNTNLHELRGMLTNLDARTRTILPVIEQHLAQHDGYVSFSGGKDSVTVVHLARTVCPTVPVVWFDSGLEYPDNRTYIDRIASAWGLNLHVIPAVPDALTLLEETGVWNHTADHQTNPINFHDTLITVPSTTAHERFGAGELSGLRVDESIARRRLLASRHGHYTRKTGAQVYAPIWDWRARDVHAYHATHKIPENPVYTQYRAVGAPEQYARVGLVLDGNALNYGRVTWLKAAYPDVYHTLLARLPRLSEWA